MIRSSKQLYVLYYDLEPPCQPHKCHHCGAHAGHLPTHGLSCCKSQGRHACHAAINNLINRSLATGKHPDGGTIVPWKGGWVLVWNATCPDTFTPSHITLAMREAGAVAVKQSKERSISTHSSLMISHHFVPIAIETSGVFGSEAITFFKGLGQRAKFESRDPRSFCFLLQRTVVAIQWGNTAAVLAWYPPSLIFWSFHPYNLCIFGNFIKIL